MAMHDYVVFFMLFSILSNLAQHRCLARNAQAEDCVMEEFHGNEGWIGKCLWIRLDGSGPQDDIQLSELIDRYHQTCTNCGASTNAQASHDHSNWWPSWWHTIIAGNYWHAARANPGAPSSSRLVGNWGFWSDPSDWHWRIHGRSHCLAISSTVYRKACPDSCLTLCALIIHLPDITTVSHSVENGYAGEYTIARSCGN